MNKLQPQLRGLDWRSADAFEILQRVDEAVREPHGLDAYLPPFRVVGHMAAVRAQQGVAKDLMSEAGTKEADVRELGVGFLDKGRKSWYPGEWIVYRSSCRNPRQFTWFFPGRNEVVLHDPLIIMASMVSRSDGYSP